MMNKKKIIKYFIMVFVSILILIGGVFGVLKVKTYLLSLNTQLGNISNNIKSLDGTNEVRANNSNGFIIKDSISDFKVKLTIDNEELYLNTENDGTTYEMDSLKTDQYTKVYLEMNGNLEIKFNNKEILPDKWNDIKIDKLSIDNKIKITLKNKLNNDTRTYFINTLPSDFPQYNLVGESQYEGDYYLTIQGLPGYLLKLNDKGEVIYYKRSKNSNLFDFKKHIIDGKVRYSYIEETSKYPSVSLAYGSGDIVILDEQYNGIDRINFIGNDEIKEGYSVESHDFLMIDDGHYIISTYLPMIVNNIPDKLQSLSSSTKVLATVLQEVKDGKVVFQWNSTNYPELYELSSQGNTFNIMSSTWNDYVHFNSIAIDPKDDNLICSFRNLDALLKIDRKSGKIIWILGGSGDQFNLTDEQKFSRQHHVTFLDENRILLYDNGNTNSLTRILELTLDEENKKVKEFKEFSIDGRFSAFMGSVQKLDDKNDVYLIGWGGAQSDTALFTEYNLKNNKVLCELHAIDDNKMTYRVYKIK